MPNYTTNYNLTKPLGSELYSIDVQNDNMDKIDDNLNRIENRFVNQNYAVNSAKKYTITGKGVDTRETLFTCDGENEDEIRSLYGKTVTVSFDYETAITDGSCDVMIENVRQTVTTFTSSSPNSGHSSTTVTLEDYTGDLNKVHLLYLQGNFSGTFTITKVKIELGNKETEWCKAVQDHCAGGTSSGGGGSTSDTIELGTGKVSGVLPIANGGTGNANGRAISAKSADTATKLTTARTIQTNLGSPSPSSFDGSTNIEPGVIGVLPIANGGTGNTSGRAASAASADKATKLANPRTIGVNLASGEAASFDGTSNVNPGVYGVLPLANGGLGATTPDGACSNIGALRMEQHVSSHKTKGGINDISAWIGYLSADGSTTYNQMDLGKEATWFKQPVSVSSGGTGNTSGLAPSATKLANPRTISVNLASGDGASFDGTANVKPGVYGVLPLANGGLGATTPDGACANIGALRITRYSDNTNYSAGCGDSTMWFAYQQNGETKCQVDLWNGGALTVNGHIVYNNDNIKYSATEPEVWDGRIWLKPI